MADYFLFNGLDSREFGVGLIGTGTYGAPSRDFNAVQIPGRHGSIIEDNGRYNDIAHWYDCYIVEDFPTNIEGFRNAIMSVIGYAELEDSFHPDEYYKAYYMAGLEPDVVTLAQAGTFRLTFTRNPQRYLKSGKEKITLTATGTVTNPTEYDAVPDMSFFGYSMTPGADAYADIQIGDTMRFRVKSPAYIDCRELISRDGPVISRSNISFITPISDGSATLKLAPPVLKPGDNNVYFSAENGTLTITPNWWRL